MGAVGWKRAGVLAFLLAAPALGQAPRSTWTHLSGETSRSSTGASGTINFASSAWVIARDLDGNVISWSGQSSPVVSRDFVFATGSVQSGLYTYLFAIDRRTGMIAWQSEIDAAEFSSFSSPAIDERGRACIVASGYNVRAFDMPSGQLLWNVALANPVVNASPVVTQDLWPSNRVFITDSDGAGISGKLYSINVSPRLGEINPHEPGEIVWSFDIGGASGNTPAYARGRLFVASAGDFQSFPPAPSEIRCFSVRAIGEPQLVWTYANTIDPDARFFGGVMVAGGASGAGGSVYAATYDFYAEPGTINNSNMVKLDAATGALKWSVASNRTSATPIVLPPRPGSNYPRVLLSTGLLFSGTAPTLQLFEDRGGSAAQVWDSAMMTWVDADGDGRLDPGEYQSFGGWTNQPAVSTGLGPLTAFVGTLPSGGNNVGFPACVRLTAINLDVLPGSASFVRADRAGAGSSPAIADGNLYTIGATGLHAFGPAPFQYDVDGDGEVSIEDLIAWQRGQGRRDVDLNGVVNVQDGSALTLELVRLGV